MRISPKLTLSVNSECGYSKLKQFVLHCLPTHKCIGSLFRMCFTNFETFKHILTLFICFVLIIPRSVRTIDEQTYDGVVWRWPGGPTVHHKVSSQGQSAGLVRYSLYNNKPVSRWYINKDRTSRRYS